MSVVTTARACVAVTYPAAHVALVTLDRPEARNAIDRGVAAGLEAAIGATNADPAIRAVILTGIGPAFCAGADLKSAAAGDGAALFTADGGFGGFATADRTKPWIAAVNGAALAGGFELALACDLVIASEAAVFGLTEVRHGLVAAGGGLARLGHRLALPLAMELALTGGSIDARRAFEMGLVNRAVAPEALAAAAIDIACTIARNAPLAVAESLRLLRRAHDHSHADLMRLSEEARLRVADSADRAEGIRAFAEKRAPRWTGH